MGKIVKILKRIYLFFLLIIVILWGNLFSFIPMTQQEAEAIQWYSNALYHLHRGDKERAIQCLNKALSLKNDYQEAQKLLEKITGKKFEFKFSLNSLFKKVNLNELTGYETTFQMQKLALTNIKKADYYKAIAILKESLLDEENEGTYFLLGYIYEKLGFLNLSEKNYLKVKSFSEKAEYLNNLAYLYLQMGKFREAEGKIKSLLNKELEDKFKPLFFDTRGWFYLLQGKTKKAVSFFNKAYQRGFQGSLLGLMISGQQVDLKKWNAKEGILIRGLNFLLQNDYKKAEGLLKNFLSLHKEAQQDLDIITMGGIISYFKKDKKELNRIKNYFSSYYPYTPQYYFFNALYLYFLRSQNMDPEVKKIVERNFYISLYTYPSNLYFHFLIYKLMSEFYQKIEERLSVSLKVKRIVNFLFKGKAGSLSGQVAAKKEEKNWKKYTDSIYGFSFKYPKDIFDVSSDEDGNYQAILKTFKQSGDIPEALITFLIETNEEGYNLDDYVSGSESMLKEGNYKQVEKKEIKMNGRKAVDLLYNFEGDLYETVFYVDENYKIAITIIMNRNKLDFYRQKFLKVIETFKIQ